ncbi:hypothetical protein ILUMI_24191 [Ignelater luminosus]|uniref:DDE-1 domain-containing protein n=1 Tax=Ignelater luminosus TaxID=2038154 RepID=A0A8K0CAP1_IGNLU|nr:hypothetical protein ILUMI_24191 [Ignelater luminosus]
MNRVRQGKSTQRPRVRISDCLVIASGYSATYYYTLAGHYIPSALIFPRKRQKPELLGGAPPGSVPMVSESECIKTDLFLEWLKHFQIFVKSSIVDPNLLLLDNRSSHISLSAIEFCRLNGIHLISLPPHNSHKVQPLDVGFFGQFQVSAIFEEAYIEDNIHPNQLVATDIVIEIDVSTILEELHQPSTKVKEEGEDPINEESDPEVDNVEKRTAKRIPSKKETPKWNVLSVR